MKIIVDKDYLIRSSLLCHRLRALRREACRSAQDMVKCAPKHLDPSSEHWNKENPRSRSLCNPTVCPEEAGESNALGLPLGSCIKYPKSAGFSSL